MSVEVWDRTVFGRAHRLQGQEGSRQQFLVIGGHMISQTHPSEAYSFIPAVSPYSAGARASRGFELAALRLLDYHSLNRGFEVVDNWVGGQKLPPSAIVGFELRIPEALNFDQFETFNLVYRQLLSDRGLLLGGLNPIARTTVVPLLNPPMGPAVVGAFVVRPSKDSGGRDFLVAGAGENAGGVLDADAIVAPGKTTGAELNPKVDEVLGQMLERVDALGSDGGSATVINVYSAHEIAGLSERIGSVLPSVLRWGYVRWLARPPIVGIEFEMDMRRVTSVDTV
jgi:hypothetical protein